MPDINIAMIILPTLGVQSGGQRVAGVPLHQPGGELPGVEPQQQEGGLGGQLLLQQHRVHLPSLASTSQQGER